MLIAEQSMLINLLKTPPVSKWNSHPIWTNTPIASNRKEPTLENYANQSSPIFLAPQKCNIACLHYSRPKRQAWEVVRLARVAT